jgi:hypothetical protein
VGFPNSISHSNSTQALPIGGHGVARRARQVPQGPASQEGLSCKRYGAECISLCDEMGRDYMQECIPDCTCLLNSFVGTFVCWN